MVVVPFVAGEGEQAYAIWTDTQQAETVGAFVERVPDISDIAYRVTSIKYTNGEAVTTTRDITNEDVREFESRYVEGSGGISTADTFPNCNNGINFECVGTAAGKAGVLFGACATCAAGGVPACVACAGSGILFVNTDCSLCN